MFRGRRRDGVCEAFHQYEYCDSASSQYVQSRRTLISRRFRPLGVFVPLRILPKNDTTASFQAASPCLSPNVPQNSIKTSFGSLRTSSLVLFSPNIDLRRVIVGTGGEAGTEVGSNSDLGDPPPRDRLNREPLGEVPWKPGDEREGEVRPDVVAFRGCSRY